MIFDTGASTVTWDLGAATTVNALAIQADANDTYTAWGSLDGNDYRVLDTSIRCPNHGLRLRTIETGGVALRYLRVGRGRGRQPRTRFPRSRPTARGPSPFPARMQVVDAPPAVVAKVYWDDDCQRALGAGAGPVGAALPVVGPMGVTRRSHRAQGSPWHGGSRSSALCKEWPRRLGSVG